MLSAVHQGRLTIGRLVELMSDNPRRIFDLPLQPDTQVEVDPEISYTIENGSLRTKCGWTPFAGMTVHGQVQRVIIRGQLAYEDGQIVAEPGSGHLLPN